MKARILLVLLGLSFFLPLPIACNRSNNTAEVPKEFAPIPTEGPVGIGGPNKKPDDKGQSATVPKQK